MEAVEAAILAALAEHGKLSQPVLLGELPQVPDKQFRSVLKQMREAGKVELEGRGKGAGYRLPEARLELDLGE